MVNSSPSARRASSSDEGPAFDEAEDCVMTDDGMLRRTFLKRAAAVSAGLVAQSRAAHAQIAVPNSVGTELP
jgi:hypothetical protein